MIESIQYQHFNFKFIIHIPYFLFLFHLSSYSYHSLQTNSFSYINTIPISIILSYHLCTKIIHQSHLGVHWSSLSVHLGPLGSTWSSLSVHPIHLILSFHISNYQYHPLLQTCSIKIIIFQSIMLSFYSTYSLHFKSPKDGHLSLLSTDFSFYSF